MATKIKVGWDKDKAERIGSTVGSFLKDIAEEFTHLTMKALDASPLSITTVEKIVEPAAPLTIDDLKAKAGGFWCQNCGRVQVNAEGGYCDECEKLIPKSQRL